MEIITRQQALAQGLKRYFEGKPCGKGHVAERQTSNWSCMECCREKDRARAGSDKRLASRKASHWRNIDVNRERDRQRGRDPSRMQRARKWKALNREHHVASSVEYTRQRLQVDPYYRLQRQLRSRLRKAFLAQGSVRAARSAELVGCTPAELKRWIEAQFQSGMSWENYGYRGWHIDHIRPCISFDLNDPEQQRQCFHYTNLQPLWGTENRAKWYRTDWQSVDCA